MRVVVVVVAVGAVVVEVVVDLVVVVVVPHTWVWKAYHDGESCLLEKRKPLRQVMALSWASEGHHGG